ncbi:fibronectin type III domain-containing protein [Jatrophihabitans sp. YIM 134969]
MVRTSRPVLLVVLAAVVAALVGTVTATPAAAAPPVPSTPGAFVGLTPSRVLDTRSGLGAPQAPAVGGRALHVSVAGRGGVPTGAGAVVLTLTVVGKAAGGYLSAYPTGAAVPTASVVNWTTGQVVAGQATVTLGTGGAVDLLVSSGKPVDLVADVSGYFLGGTPNAPGAYVGRTPTRLLDTRAGVGGPRGALAKGATTTVAIAGRGGLPAATGISAVTGTLTAVRSTTSGYLTVWGGGDKPTVSSLNFAAGQVVSNQVTVPVDASGAVRVFAGGGPVDVVLDVTGFVIGGAATEPGTFVALPPARAFDSRTSGPLPIDQEIPLTLPGTGGVPTTRVAAVVANLTVTNAGATGYLTTYPAGGARPATSNLNWTAGRTVANQATLTVGDGGADVLYLATTRGVSVVVDVSGYYLPALPATPQDLTATPTTTSVTLQWTEPGADVGYPESFDVRRLPGSVPPASRTDGTPVSGVPSDTGVVDTGLTPGTTYSYAVFAVDRTHVNFSAPATVTVTTLPPDLTPPGPDTALITSSVGTTTVTLHWTRPADADYADTVLRSAVGTTPPGPPTGNPVGVGGRTDTVIVQSLASGATYTFAAYARDSSGNVSPTASTTTFTTAGTQGVVGTTVPVPPGAFDPQKQVTGQDCPPSGSCVVVAGYYDETAARHGLLLIGVVGVDGTVSSTPVPLPSTAASFTKPVAAVSCAADADCEIVGTYVDDATGDRRAFAAHWNGAAAASALLPTVDVDARAIDCPVTGNCVAVGGRSAASAEQPWAARLAGGAWTDATFNTSAASVTYALGSVACATATSCAATGDSASTSGAPAALVASTTTGANWTARTLPAPSGSTGWTGLGRVTCPVTGICAAGGRYASPSSSTTSAPALLSWRAGTWSTELLPTTSADATDVTDVACSSALCSVLVGLGTASVLLTRPVTGGTWTIRTQSALPAGATTETKGLSGIACTADGRCGGVGAWTDSAHVSHGFVAALSTNSSNSATTVEPSVAARLGGAALSDPVCTADGQCVATGNYLATTEDAWVASFRIVGG